MRKYEMMERKYEEKVLVETRCDLCGAIAKRGEWRSTVYEVNETEIEVTVRQKDGESYPEGGGGTEIIVDICPRCFKEKLVPWLNSQGANIKSAVWGW